MAWPALDGNVYDLALGAPPEGRIMITNLWERYGPYSKKKGKKRGRIKKGDFLNRSPEWLKWKVTISGGSSFYYPCLAH
jgi:hypothetical protein